MPDTEITQSKAIVPARTIVLDLASSREGLKDDNFVVIPPEKKGKLQAVHFSDGKAIRRTIGITNQMMKQEIVQMCDPETGIPPYTLGDPQNVSGLSGVPVHPQYAPRKKLAWSDKLMPFHKD